MENINEDNTDRIDRNLEEDFENPNINKKVNKEKAKLVHLYKEGLDKIRKEQSDKVTKKPESKTPPSFNPNLLKLFVGEENK